MLPPIQSSSAVQFRQIDPKIWGASAGITAQIPTLGSKVYYFIQGHVEQCADLPFLSPHVLYQPVVPCIISAVELLADSRTDEVFAKLMLNPIKDQDSDVPLQFCRNDVADDDDTFASFSKILTSSDANNGGGFSVPRYCADTIFPPLNFQADPPVQTLSVTDVHGVVWNFRHIYRGTPRRHLLTTGWSKFVNNKKLVAGDSVVFTRNKRGEMFVGVRRAGRSNGGSECATWSSPIIGARNNLEEKPSEEGGKEVFSRNGLGKPSGEAVSKAVELAIRFMPFEVVYYPRAGWSEFVVKAEKVDESLNFYWSSGIRVKKAMETEDSSKMSWFQGTVTSVSFPGHGLWLESPWRMLEVAWDEPEALQKNGKTVSPWEIEFASPAQAPAPAPLHPAKRFRGSQTSGMLMGEDLLPPIIRFSDSTAEQFNPSLLNYNNFPAGMQGARQSLLSESRLFDCFNDITPSKCADNSSCNLNVVPVSTELLIGGSSQPDDWSPNSQCSVISYASEAAGNQINNSTKVRKISFQLFGQLISTNQLVENALEYGVFTNDGGSNPNRSS